MNVTSTLAAFGGLVTLQKKVTPPKATGKVIFKHD